jgi:hypothetical protein
MADESMIAIAPDIATHKIIPQCEIRPADLTLKW